MAETEDGENYAHIVQKITDYVITNYLTIDGNEEFDRFLATQDYLKAYDHALENYPSNRYLAERKKILMKWLRISFINIEVQSGE